MKIKFIKPFRLYNPIGDDIMMGEGAIENVKEDYAEWLIDNGFAEKVDDEWPMVGEKYYIVGAGGAVLRVVWRGDSTDKDCQAIGNIFKTEEATKRRRTIWKPSPLCDRMKALLIYRGLAKNMRQHPRTNTMTSLYTQ